MYLVLLIISLALLLAICYYFFFARDAATPALSFVLGMLVCASLLTVYTVKWGVHIHEKTFELILFGCVSLILGSILAKRINAYKHKNVDEIDAFIPITSLRLKGILVLQIILAFLQTYFLFRFYGQSSIAENLVAHTMAIKFDSQEAMKLPFGVGYITGLTYNIAYVFAFLLPLYYQRRNIYREQFLLCVINFVASLIISLLSSGRSGMLWMLISVGTFYVITIQRSGRRLNMKRIAIWSGGAYIFLISFMYLGTLIGREYNNDETTTDIIVEYCGAEIQNLDDYLRGPIEKTCYFGEMSFQTYYRYLEKTFKIVKLSDRREDTLSFNQRKGYGLGNVYTAFQDYYIDFGFIGSMIICFVVGFIIQRMYHSVLRQKSLDTGCMTWKTYLYSLVVPSMFMSFFSEAFFNSACQIATHRFWATYIILYLLFYGKLPWMKNS